ncbi:glycosyltransferase [Vibrio sp. 05-20-BW147]|uniref:glycosyltransferase n=1 Tax=Vibrio sp. 05-20-BW147 TaxID=2575834 RepID=UPI001594310B|nr:glycosyltransferase [Vibrio sp. 05-20-BW147]NVC63221.1 glycosyltransferase [Vibrio sp. 05-20-BW147]
MKLCIVMNSLAIGGSERKMVHVANFLIKSGLDVTVLSLKKKNDDFVLSLLDSGVKVDFAEGVPSIFRYFILNRFDSFFLLNSYPALFSSIIRILNFSSVICYLNNTSVLPSGYSSFKFVLLKLSARFVSSVVYGADSQRVHWHKNYGFSFVRNKVVYNGVDLDFYEKTKADTSSCLKIAMVGQLRKEKNHIEAINVLKMLVDNQVDARLSIVGGDKEGKVKAYLESLVDKNNLNEYVQFHGEVRNVKDILIDSNVFLLCSNSVETFSNAVLEAMAIGLPVVISDIGGAREMVESGASGLVYEPGNTKELFEKLVSLTSTDYRNELIYNARRRVEDKFSSEKMMNEYLKLAKGIL